VTWHYNGKPFTSEMIEDNLGFVYIVTEQKEMVKTILAKRFSV